MKTTRPARHSVDTLNAVKTELSESLQKLEACIGTMGGPGSSVVLDAGQAEMERGLVGISNFVTNLEKAIRKARIASGHFGDTAMGNGHALPAARADDPAVGDGQETAPEREKPSRRRSKNPKTS